MEKDLEYYRNHAVYGLCFEGLKSSLMNISILQNQCINQRLYNIYFASIETDINDVLKSSYPDIETSNKIAHYHNQLTIPYGCSTSYDPTGIVLELTFLVALYESIKEDVREILMPYFSSERNYLSMRIGKATYADKLWALIAERIPCSPDEPRVQDLLLEIEKLKKDKGYKNSQEENKGLESQLENLQKRINEFEEILNPTTIPDECLEYVESVFLPSFRLLDESIPTYPQVRQAAKYCIDPNEPTHIPIFIAACIARKCARVTARNQPDKVLKALIGLGILRFKDEETFKNYRTSISQKTGRMRRQDEMKEDEKELFDSAYEILGKIDDDSLFD